MRISDIVFYFKQLAAQHKNIRSFAYMNESRLLSLQPTDIEYPCLMLFAPATMYDGTEGQAVKKYQCSFAILEYSSIDDTDEQDFVIDETEGIVEDLIVRIVNEDFIETIDIKDFNSEIVKAFTHDNLYGWRVNFSFSAAMPDCINEEMWSSLEIPANPSAFVFENTVENGFKVTLAGEEDTTYEVTIDEKNIKVKNGVFDFKVKIENRLTAKVIATKVVEGVKYQSVAYISNKKYSGVSMAI